MAIASLRPDVTHYDKAAPAEKDLVEKVAACVEAFEKGIGLDFKERSEGFYKQYRGFRAFRDAWVQAGPNDRDGVIYDAKKHWGAHLHIPLSFRTIETMVPAAIAHRPRMLYLPREEKWERNVMNVRLLLEAQQEQIDIDLPFQAVMRSGMIYGLGVGKALWRKEYAKRRRAKRRMFVPWEFELGPLEAVCVHDDPDYEDVDIFDFMWDPFGSDMRSVGWVVHRTWLSLEGVLERLERGSWATESARALAKDGEAAVRSMGNGQKYDDVWQERMNASGFSTFHHSTRGEQIHEVWEWHDGDRVLTVLDRQVLVQDGENPCVGSIPFQVYRPTPLQKQMVGIGELEPIQHLQRELDTLRSQRRDAATLALAAGYAYDDAAVDVDDLVFGPAAAIRVTNARPQDAIMPLRTQDVPGSSDREEASIRADIDAVSGINDALDPRQASTATESMLVQAALSKRIRLKSRRFEIEVVRSAARAWLHLNQRMILENRDPIRQPAEGLNDEQAAAEGRWRWFDIGPGALRGEYEIIPEGGSMAEENVPQMRQDAVQLMQLFGQSPHIEPRAPLMKALSLFGVKDPEAWLKQQDAPVPPMAIEILKQAVDPQLVDYAVRQAQMSDPRLNAPQDEGPSPEQVNAMMGAQQ